MPQKSHGIDKRDKRAIDEIECPQCHAAPGKPCYWRGQPTFSLPGMAGRLFIHPERRAANQERRRLAGEAGPVQPPKGTPNAPRS